MIVTRRYDKTYRHDEAGLKALQAEHPDVYAKVVKNKPEKVEEAPKAVKAKKRQAK